MIQNEIQKPVTRNGNPVVSVLENTEPGVPNKQTKQPNLSVTSGNNETRQPVWDVIMLALPRWDGHYSSTAFSLAKALSAHTRVFYIDNPFTFKDYFTHRHSPQIKRRRGALIRGEDAYIFPDKSNPNLIVATPRLVFPVNWLPPGKLYDRLARHNDEIVYRVINKMMEQFAISKFIFINSFNPLFGKFFPSDFKPLIKVYHCVDDISKSIYISKHGTRLERHAVKNADVTLVTSLELNRLKSIDSRQVHYLPNAANVELFQQSLQSTFSKPVEIKKVEHGRKIICYMGNICHRIDYELLKKIAKLHNDKVLLMIGPHNNDRYKKAGLDNLPNVIFTGSKPLEQLPAYLQHCDCCIIPFLCIELTKSIYPLKINEYLSAGKPVVTTNFSDDIKNFESVAYVSSTHEDFLSNIERAIQNDSNEAIAKRVKFSSANSWEARALSLIEIVQSNLKKNFGA